MERPRSRPTIQDPTPITYLGESTFLAKGAATGLTYLFARHEALEVDARDARAFVATGMFAAG